EPRRGAARLRPRPDPGDEPRAAAEARARRVPRGRRRLQPRPRRPVPVERARRGDRGDAVSAPWLLRLLRVTAGAAIGLYAFETGHEWVGTTVVLLTAAFALAPPSAWRRAA